MRPVVWVLGLAMIMASCHGCHTLELERTSASRSLLQPASPLPDSVALEIFWARYPYGNTQLNEQMWQEIDESQIPVRVRRQLGANGFRAGVVSSLVPEPLAEVLQLHRPTAENSPDEEAIDSEPTQQELLASLLDEASVTHQRRQLPPNKRWELLASDVYPEVPLLIAQKGELSGKTFHDGQAVYAIELNPKPDGRVALQISPELHYGQARLRYSGGDGILRQKPMRDREMYQQLEFEVALAPGEMLVMVGTSETETCLGHYFHTTTGGASREQKLIVLRLAQIPDSQAFEL